MAKKISFSQMNEISSKGGTAVIRPVDKPAPKPEPKVHKPEPIQPQQPTGIMTEEALASLLRTISDNNAKIARSFEDQVERLMAGTREQEPARQPSGYQMDIKRRDELILGSRVPMMSAVVVRYTYEDVK